MDLSGKKYFYFLGIGGIGMSALARYFNHSGIQVSGYDKAPTSLTDALIQEGIDVHFEDNIECVHQSIRINKNETLVIYTPAVPKDHGEYVYFLSNGYDIKKRSEVLGLITRQTHSIAVAGTHGKTTTSSMIAHLLKSSGLECSAFLGGITQNYNTNLLLSERPATTVVEADEYDRSFLTLHPDIAVITSLDADHLDIYGSQEELVKTYSLFSEQVKKGGILITKERNTSFLGYPGKTLTYGIDDHATYSAKNVTVKKGLFNYSIVCPDCLLENITLGVPGLYNVENSVAAVAVARQMGIAEEKIKEGLRTFKGVRRRFDVQFSSDDVVYVDDYAHHPSEINAFLGAVRQVYEGKKITVVFQPHLFSRTRDFMEEFSQSLSQADELILLDIYPARENPIPGVDSGILLNKVKLENKKLCAKNELLEEILRRKLEVLVTIGAGDIDAFIEPIKMELKKKYVKAH